MATDTLGGPNCSQMADFALLLVIWTHSFRRDNASGKPKLRMRLGGARDMVDFRPSILRRFDHA